VQARAQSKRLELAFQAASRKCQQALGGDDKSGLASARDPMESFAQNGPHTGEAQKCVDDINAKLNALNQPPVPVTPPSAPQPAKRETPNTAAADEAAVRDVVQMFFQAFEQRNPEGLSRLWPSIPQKRYDGWKNAFASASVITMQIMNESVTVSPDGGTATVSVQAQQQYTAKAQKMSKKSEASWKFQLTKRNGVWVITDVQ
jgi:hypothetical protein